MRNHSTNLLLKLGVRSNSEAVMVALQLGVVAFNGGKPEIRGPEGLGKRDGGVSSSACLLRC